MTSNPQTHSRYLVCDRVTEYLSLTSSHLGDLIHSQPGGWVESPPSVTLLSIKPNLV